MATARDIPHGSYNSNDTVLRHANDRIGIRFRPDYDFTMYRFGVLQRLDGTTYVGGSTNGYARGTGGTGLMRAVLMDPVTGLPDYSRELGREQVAIQTVWSRSRASAYPGASTLGQFMFYQFPTGLTMLAGRLVWFILSNVDADPANNWFCMNGPNGPASGTSGDLGYQGVNYPFQQPTTTRALYGMDPTEVVAWSVTGDNGPWYFGELGGLHGQTRPPKPADRNGPGTGYYAKEVTPFFAWTEAPGNVKFKRTCGENAYGSGSTVIGNLEGISKVDTTVTHVNAICATSPGIVTFLNVTTGVSSIADLSTGYTAIPSGREKALNAGVPIAIGQRFRISSTGPVRNVQPDSSTVPYMETTLRSSSGSVNTPQLGAQPWPLFPEQTMTPPPPDPEPGNCDAIIAERDAAIAERDAALASLNSVTLERDALLAKNTAALGHVNSAKTSIDAAITALT